jgi:competence protein ComEA
MAVALVAVGVHPALAHASDDQTETETKTKALRVDLNSADAEQLEQLPGIGETVAKRIIEYREQNGPFTKSEELMNVRGIGEKTFLKLRPFLSVSSKESKSEK